MIKRDQIEAILKINGVPPGSADEEIRSVLLSARYSKDEADTAIMVLRENTKTNQTRVEGLHKVFRSDEALKPEEISQLLGIEVDITETITSRSRGRDLTTVHILVIWVLSVLLAIIGVLFFMQMYQVGVFHPSVAYKIF